MKNWMDNVDEIIKVCKTGPHAGSNMFGHFPNISRLMVTYMMSDRKTAEKIEQHWLNDATKDALDHVEELEAGLEEDAESILEITRAIARV